MRCKFDGQKKPDVAYKGRADREQEQVDRATELTDIRQLKTM